MRRLITAILVLVTVAAAGVSGTLAQDATPVAPSMTDHPLVGTWLADTDPENPGNAPALFLFFADGGYLEYDPEEGGDVGAGRWQATGDLTADLTLLFLSLDDEGAYEGTFKIRARIEVAEDGQTFTAEYTGEFTLGSSPSGSGEYGPGAVTAERISVEPMGAPVGSFEELFGSEDEATPEA
jgi:hypothetical protein